VPISTAKTDQITSEEGKMKRITLRTMAAFWMALLGGIALIIVLAVGLNVLSWLD